MRGIEAALKIWGQVKKGGIVSESLRAVSSSMAPGDRTLAASLAYSLVRRFSLWQLYMEHFLKPRPAAFSWQVRDAVMMGAAGLMDLRTFAPAALISGLVDWTKNNGDVRGARVVNSVLRRVLELGKALMADLVADPSLDALCLRCGLPSWIGEQFVRQYGNEEGRRLIMLQQGGGALSLRISASADIAGVADRLGSAGLGVEQSPLAGSLRLTASALPNRLPGYAEGAVTPQSESSMVVGRLAVQTAGGGRFLDMCAGRGIKTGQIAAVFPGSVEAWDLSEGRVAAGRREMERLGLTEKVTYREGNALSLVPIERPYAVLIDAPCSGSGTWRRHPESKWRLTLEVLHGLSKLQQAMLERALEMTSCGTVIYSTCSLLNTENENVVQQVMRKFPDIHEVPLQFPIGGVAELEGPGFIIRPENPWTDGFYLVVLRRGESQEVER